MTLKRLKTPMELMQLYVYLCPKKEVELKSMKEFIMKWSSENGITYAIFDKSNEIIGGCAMYKYPKSFTLTWCHIEPSARCKTGLKMFKSLLLISKKEKLPIFTVIEDKNILKMVGRGLKPIDENKNIYYLRGSG